MRYINLESYQYDKIKEVSYVKHVSEFGTYERIFFTMYNMKLGPNQFVTNFRKVNLGNKLSFYSSDTFRCDYDIVTIPEDKMSFVSDVINDYVKILK